MLYAVLLSPLSGSLITYRQTQRREFIYYLAEIFCLQSLYDHSVARCTAVNVKLTLKGFCFLRVSSPLTFRSLVKVTISYFPDMTEKYILTCCDCLDCCKFCFLLFQMTNVKIQLPSFLFIFFGINNIVVSKCHRARRRRLCQCCSSFQTTSTSLRIYFCTLCLLV